MLGPADTESDDARFDTVHVTIVVTYARLVLSLSGSSYVTAICCSQLQ